MNWGTGVGIRGGESGESRGSGGGATRSTGRPLHSPGKLCRAGAALWLLLIVLTGCTGRDSGKGADTLPDSLFAGRPEITGVELARASGSGQPLLYPATEFAPTDTIQIRVRTRGRMEGAAVTLRVLFVADSSELMREDRVLTLRDRDLTEFTLWTAYGLRAGVYRADVHLNGAPSAAPEFRVR